MICMMLRPRHWSDAIDTRLRHSKMPRDRLETELFETETTTIMNSVVYKV